MQNALLQRWKLADLFSAPSYSPFPVVMFLDRVTELFVSHLSLLLLPAPFYGVPRKDLDCSQEILFFSFSFPIFTYLY